ncbi:MAG TPA: helix-turn-helix transcriptional regulator [Solirubrobacteraceae bacterium]|nr:helix-turn-helix transcriptional regulator [Solirubrobacteraceae bacterium]
MRPRTHESRRRLYLMARVVIARHYRQPLTLERVARALATSPRQIQRAFEQFGGASFSEQLMERRLSVAADVLLEQRSIPVAAVARLVGYRQGSHFARAFRRRYGVPPAEFRARGADTRGEAGVGGVALEVCRKAA